MRELDYTGVIEKLVSFIGEKVSEARVKGVVIGVSGGIDSATTAYLAVRALGRERVQGLIMPYYQNRDVEDAKLVCESLGVECKVINIKPIVDSSLLSLAFSRTSAPLATLWRG